MKAEMSTLSTEVMMLRYHTAAGSNADDVLTAKAKYIKIEDRDEVVSLSRQSDKRLRSARHEEMELAISIKSYARDGSKFILRSEHATMLRKHEDELIADMSAQLVKRSC